MEDRDWLILQELYRMKNITKAAQELYMSQPALTSRLQHIEREFDVRIVNRSTKGVKFTPEGEYLVKQSSDLLEKLNEIKNGVHQLSDKISGTIEIGASNYFTLYSLPALLENFKRQYPDVKFLVSTDWSKNISNDIYRQKLQIGFVSVDYGGCTNMHLLYEEPICVANKEPFSLEDLPHLPRIDYQSDYLLKSQLDKWWREYYSQPPVISMRVSKLENCKLMVTHGLGYSIIPYRIVKDEPSLHTIIIKDVDGKELTRTSWMLYNEESLVHPCVRLFIEFVKNYNFAIDQPAQKPVDPEAAVAPATDSKTE